MDHTALAFRVDQHSSEMFFCVTLACVLTLPALGVSINQTLTSLARCSYFAIISFVPSEMLSALRNGSLMALLSVMITSRLCEVLRLRCGCDQDVGAILDNSLYRHLSQDILRIVVLGLECRGFLCDNFQVRMGLWVK
jgi:hypothetical protein